MIRPQGRVTRKALACRLTAYAITWAAILYAGAIRSSAQPNKTTPVRAASANVEFANGQSALNIPFDFQLNEIILRVQVNGDGPLGNEIMRRFKVTIDYSRQRMMLEPNSHFSEPFESDMSGIAIDAEGKDCRTFKVEEVTEKSPAAQSGVLTGDEIVAIDGKPANQFTSSRIEKLLMEDGAMRSLTLRRDDKVHVVTIKLRRRI